MSGSGLAGFGRSLAFLVGIDRYTNGVPELRTAVADVESVADVLRKEHGFRTKVSTDENATIGRLRWSLKALRRWVRPDDRVLFYFAGHGIAVESDEGPRGYILPQDADRNSIAGCLPMVELDEALSMVRCRHMLVVLDCCFAGAFRWSSFRHLALRPENLHQERYAWFIRDPAWQAIASAAHDQRAIDVVAGEPLGERGDGGEHSPFARALLDGLKGAADRAPAGGTGDGVITATELFLYLQDKLLPPPLRQAPILWPLKNHHRGEFVFLVPGRQLDLPPGPPLDPNANPWRGLQPYERAHADLFFGRSRASERLRARVLAEQFVVVTGPSGIGKSSLVRAGLLPRLPAGIEPLVVRPGPQPFGSLAAVLRDATPQGTSSPDAKVLKADVYALAKWVKARTGGRELLLVLDQAEELITQNREAKATQDFLALFASALDQTDARLRLVITIRSEFEPQFAQSPLSNRWSTARYLVPQMTQDELRRVIEGPAAVKVMRFEEDGLVDQLINEVVNMPGALPLLSFALSEMYAHYLTRQSDDRTLTWSDYNALQGGVTGSLRVRANQVVDSVDEAHRATARRVLERLVSVDAGEFARRRVPKSELDAPDPEENARIDEVIERLDAARLIVTDEADGKDILELAHDALILGWDRLLAWVREDLERIITLRRLSPDARQWAFSLPRRPSLLWSDAARLATIKALRMFASPGLNRVEASFAQASIERAKRNQRLRTAVGAALVLLTIGAGIGAYYSWTQTLVARRQTENAVANETRSLTALSIVASERGNHGDGLTLALAAWPRSALNDVRPRLETTLQAISLALSASQGEISRLEAPGRIHNVWFDEARMTAIGEVGDDTIAVWDLRPGGVPMRKVNIPEKVWSVEVSNDRNRVLTRSDDGSFRLFDRELKQLGSTMKHGDRVSNAMFSPSGTRIVTWSRDGTARLWDAQDGTPIGRPMQHPEAVEAAFFSAAGRYVVTWSNTSLYLWDPATASLIKGPLESGSLARGVLTFDDDRRMLSWSIDKDIKLWDVESGSRLGEGLMHDGPADGAILLDGNTKLLTWSSFSDLRLWDVQTYQQIGNVMTHEYSVDGVTVTEDEKIAFSWSGEYLYVWDLQSAAARCPPMQNDGSVRGAAFSNAQDKILAWTEKGKLRLWDIKACKEAVPEMAHGPMTYGYQSASWEKPKLSLPSNGIVAINGATFSRDDHRILSWSEDGTLRAWDTATGHQIGPERRHFGVVGGVALFDGDSRAVSWAGDRSIRVWDLRTGQQTSSAVRTGENGIGGALLTRNERAIVYWSGDLLATVNAHTGAAILPPIQHWGIRGAKLNSDATKILSWSRTHGIVKLHSMIDGRLLIPEIQHSTSWTEAEFTRDERSILSWSNGMIKVTSAETGLQIGDSMEYPGLAEIEGVVQRSDSKRFASWSRDGVIKLWDGTQPGRQIGNDIEQGRVPAGEGPRLRRGALFLPDGRLLVWGKTGELHIFDSETGADLQQPIVHGSEVLGATVSPSGSRLVSWSLDGVVRVWSLPNLKPLAGSMNHEDVVDGVALTSDGRYAISWSSSHIIVWETESGKRIGSRMTHEELIGGISLSRDQSKIVSWTFDGSIHLWDLQSGQQIAAPLRHGRGSDGIGFAFSSDGTRLLSWGDEFLRWWNIDFGAGDLLKIACTKARWVDVGNYLDKFGVTVSEPICAPEAMPAPLDWTETVPATALLRLDNRYDYR